MNFDVELTKKIAIVLSFATTLSTVSVLIGLLSYKLDNALFDLKELKDKVAVLESQSASRDGLNQYQNLEHKRMQQEIDRLKNAVFAPRATSLIIEEF